MYYSFAPSAHATNHGHKAKNYGKGWPLLLQAVYQREPVGPAGALGCSTICFPCPHWIRVGMFSGRKKNSVNKWPMMKENCHHFGGFLQ